MRILACSDFQLGAGPDYGAAPGDRLRDQRAALEFINATASEHEVDLILFCGDAFERRRPTASELNVFKHWLDYAPVAVVAISGNHDATGAMEPTSLNVFQGRSGFQLSTFPGVCHADGADVALLPWAHPGVERAGVGPRGVDPVTRLLAVAAGLRAQCEPDRPALLALHWAMSGCSLPGGLPTSALREVVIPLDDLRAQGWDGIVGGHIHKIQRPAGNVWVCGSPTVSNFGEANLQHGVWIIETHPAGGLDAAVAYLVEVPDRPFLTFNVDLTTMYPDGRVLWAGADDVEGAVVRVRYRATEEQARRVDQARLKRDLYAAGAHKVYAIEATVVKAERARAEGANERLSPEEALEMWLGHADVDGVDPAELRKTASRYFEEVR